MHERLPPGLTHDLRADDRVAQLAGQANGKLLAAVDRKREHVRCLVLAEMIVLQLPHLVRADEHQAEVARVDSLLREHLAREVSDGALLDLGSAAVCDLDRDHLGVTSDAAYRSPPRAS